MIRWLLLTASIAAAADVNGIWSGQLPTRFGEIEDLSLRFVQKGTVLTGKMYGDNESTGIQEATLEGEQIRFVIVTELNGGPRRFVYSGTVKGDRMELSRKRELLPGDPNTNNRAAPQAVVLRKLL